MTFYNFTFSIAQSVFVMWSCAKKTKTIVRAPVICLILMSVVDDEELLLFFSGLFC